MNLSDAFLRSAVTFLFRTRGRQDFDQEPRSYSIWLKCKLNILTSSDLETGPHIVLSSFSVISLIFHWNSHSLDKYLLR